MKMQTDILYVKSIIKPLEELIIRIELSSDFSKQDVELLNQLLTEKYIVLEHILQENSSNSQQQKRKRIGIKQFVFRNEVH